MYVFFFYNFTHFAGEMLSDGVAVDSVGSEAVVFTYAIQLFASAQNRMSDRRRRRRRRNGAKSKTLHTAQHTNVGRMFTHAFYMSRHIHTHIESISKTTHTHTHRDENTQPAHLSLNNTCAECSAECELRMFRYRF